MVSIFVNPTQFGPAEDLDRYPRSPEADSAALAALGVHAIYAPDAEAMYPAGNATVVHVGGPVGERLEAVCRPGHLDGVALVVAKLFVAARPERAYFGAKDAQQCTVVARLAADLDTGVQVVICPTVRDRDGLALSSRNAYLATDERERARAIPAGLAAASVLFDRGERDAAALVARVRAELDASALTVDYVSIVEPERFLDVQIAAPACEIVVAARIGNTRLIDSLRLGIDEAPDVPGVTKQQECSGSS